MNFYSVNTCEKVKSGNILMYNNFLFCQLCILSNFFLSTLYFVKFYFVNSVFCQLCVLSTLFLSTLSFVNSVFVNSVFCQLCFCQLCVLSTLFLSTLCFVNSVLSTVILSNHDDPQLIVILDSIRNSCDVSIYGLVWTQTIKIILISTVGALSRPSYRDNQPIHPSNPSIHPSTYRFECSKPFYADMKQIQIDRGRPDQI